jgi:hypothetical protein
MFPAGFLPVRNRAAVASDNIGSSFHFGQATKYGHMTKLKAARCPAFDRLPARPRRGNADDRRVAEPRFEIDKAAPNDKRNGL